MCIHQAARMHSDFLATAVKTYNCKKQEEKKKILRVILSYFVGGNL